MPWVKEDIAALAQHFMKKHLLTSKNNLRISAGAYAAMLDHDWPGNIRELENAIIRGIYLAEDDQVTIENLGLPSHTIPYLEPFRPPFASPNSFKESKQQMIESFERRYLTQLMHDHQGNVSRAARAAGKERRDLGKLLKKYHLDPNTFCAAGIQMNQYCECESRVKAEQIEAQIHG